MKRKAKQPCNVQGRQANSGFSLIELIVSILVSSIIILSAIMFFSFALNRYRSTAEETDLMMESQIAVTMVKEVVMEAKEVVKSGSFSYGGVEYPYIAVRTGSGADVDGNAGIGEYYHLFLADTVGHVLLYYREPGAGHSVPDSCIMTVFFGDGRLDEEDRKRYFLADHLKSMKFDNTNPQLNILNMEFEFDDRTYEANETILVRNTLPDATE